ncbi:MAG: hypothetical protein CTY29_02235 [Methylobacter sp.]|nr:MAG: hypothetical protein CTY29_02235 [Methylobacter sp.]
MRILSFDRMQEVGFFALFVGLTLLNGCGSPEEEAKDHLQRGIELFKKGEFDKAKLELKTSSQADQKTAETYFYLALMDEKNGQVKAMRDNLTKALELAPDNSDIKLKLGKAQLLMNEPEAALALVDAVLAVSGDNQEALLLKASVFAKQKKNEDANLIIDNLVQLNPSFVDALTLKASMLAGENKFDESLLWLAKAIEVDPQNASLYSFRAQVHSKLNQPDEVINDYQQLIKLNPENDGFKIGLAKIYNQLGKEAEAEALLQGMVKEKQGKVEPKLLLLEFLSAVDPAKLAPQFNQFVDEHENEPKMLFRLSEWMVLHNRFADVKPTLARIVTLEKDKELGQAAKTLQAKIAIEEKDLAQAKQIVDNLLKANPNLIQAQILQARLLAADKEYDQAIDMLNKVLWSQADSEEALVLLGQLYIAKNDLKQSLEQFKKILELNPGHLQALSIIYEDALTNSANPKYAKEILLRALSAKGPSYLFALEKLAQLTISEKDWETAQKVIDEIARTPNAYTGDLTKFLQARLLQQQGEYTKAIALYKELIDKLPEHKDALLAMAQSYESIGKRREMMVFLDQLANNSQSYAASLLLSDMLVLDKQYEKASTLLESLIKQQKNDPEIFVSLAKIKLALNQPQAAESVYRQGLDLHPNDLRLSLALASLYSAQSNFDAAKSLYEALLSKSPDIAIVANNLAALLVNHGNSAEDLQRAVELTEKFKSLNQDYFRDTYAWVLIKQGNVPEALKILNQLIISNPNEPVFRYHLGVAQYKSGNNGMAISELKQAIELAGHSDLSFDKANAEKLLQDILGKARGG